MKNNTKKQILEILQNFRISRGELRECLASAYEKNSRMPEFITRKVNPHKLRSAKIINRMWNEFGIPHQIFYNLDDYIEEEVATEEDETKHPCKAS